MSSPKNQGKKNRKTALHIVESASPTDTNTQPQDENVASLHLRVDELTSQLADLLATLRPDRPQAVLDSTTIATDDVSHVPSPSQFSSQPSVVPRVNTSLKPEQLTNDFTLSQFKSWKSQWRDYFVMNLMDRLPPEGQSAYLRSCISSRTLDTIRIYMGVSVGATCVTILDSLAEYFTRQSNITLRRVEFSTCKQLEGESFEQFFVRLTLLHENSDPCTHCQEDQMVTRLIAGIEDVELRQKLLAMQKPTVQTLKEACQATESSRIDGHTLEQDAKFQRVLNKRTLSQSGPPSLPFREPFSEARHHSLKSCPGCFIQHDRRACIHRNSTCHHCGKTGHIQPVCYALNRRPKLYTNNESSKNNTIKICAVTSPAPTIVVQVLCQGRSFDATALPDSGADDNLISIHLLNKFGQFKLRPADNRIRAANDSPIQCLGIVEMDVTFHARQIHISAFVTSDVTDFLLSWRVSQQMGLLSPLYPLPDYLSPPPGISRVISNLEPMTRCHQILSQHTIDPDPALVHATKSALVAEFSDVFCPPDDLPPMACEPMDIHLKNYDKASRSLRPLQVGTTVIIQDQSGRKEWNRVGIVTASRSHRDYDIELPSGRTLRRNRRHLYPTTIPPNPPASSPAVLYDPSPTPRRSSRKTIGQVPHRFQF
ncbi:hypothetical protein TCAL_14929 [Tigriopus californicus]|uniref:CCHC-type domain-containing protein n=1 Tax=Tigriopus californicus TaxID=6832 RepID=A0A553N932_TIGCA|nr:hypothetical protein TCAL_14929 [Tigriopus californicus]